MNRVGEYIWFAMWFTGLGYPVLWPFTAYDMGVRLQLSPGLHLAGMMASTGVLICLLLHPLRRRWRARKANTGAALPPSIIRLRIGKKSAPPPLPYVRPRSQFGLRGARQ